MEIFEHENDSPNIILTLVAKNDRTSKIWARPENCSRYVHPSFNGEELSGRSMRRSTPVLPDPDRDIIPDIHGEPDTEPSIQLNFKTLPKNPALGFVFGSDSDLCDVYLGLTDHGFSRRAFCIRFNDHGDIVMDTASVNSTQVTYNSQAGGKRFDFRWIFFTNLKKLFVEVAGRLEFEIIIPKHGIYEAAYKANVEKFLRPGDESWKALFQLDIESRPDTRAISGAATPARNDAPYYYRCLDLELGRGNFGVVYLVRDASTGKYRAAKEFRGKYSRKEAEMLKSFRHVGKPVPLPVMRR